MRTAGIIAVLALVAGLAAGYGAYRLYPDSGGGSQATSVPPPQPAVTAAPVAAETTAQEAPPPAALPQSVQDAMTRIDSPLPVAPVAGATSGGSAGVGGSGTTGSGSGGSGGGTAGGSIAGGPPDTFLPNPALVNRMVVRTASVELEVEDVVASVKAVETLAVTSGGFVSRSSVFVKPQETAGATPAPAATQRTETATLEIKVPAAAYDGVVNALRGIATVVRSESSQTEEVAEEHADLEARLRNLEATEARYLDLLSDAGTIPDILTMEDRLHAVRLQIEEVDARLTLLTSLADEATISVTLRPPPPAPVVQPLPTPAPLVEPVEEPNWADEAWTNAWETSEDVLEAMGTAAITAGFVLVWALVPVTVLLLMWRRIGGRRARKEA
jgi:hypothetical protein